MSIFEDIMGSFVGGWVVLPRLSGLMEIYKRLSASKANVENHKNRKTRRKTPGQT